MRKIILWCFFLCYVHMQAQQYPDFKPMRYDENYEALHNDTVNKNWYKSIKFVPLSASGKYYASFGGDLRYQYFYAHNEDWGDAPQDHDGYVLGRFLFHGDLHAGKYFRTFAQLQGSTADGRIDPSPVEQNPLELHQAFADVIILNSDKKKLVLRAGRQELSYGSQRLIAVRDGPNNRQSFDAVKASIANNNYTADLFYGRYVAAKDGIFDDESGVKKQLWGSYFVISNVPLIKNIDLYYLGYKRLNAVFDDGMAIETRHSTGTRIWGKDKNWRYDGEAIFQFGKFGAKDIRAWTASLNTGYKIATVKYHPEIGLKVEVISGDRNKSDNSLKTFNPLFPRGAYFGLASVVGPSNLVDLHPSVNFDITKNINWSFDYDMFWRYSTEDGIYAPNASMIYPAGTSGSKDIGKQLESEIVYQPNQYLYFRAEITWFEAGDYLKASGAGKDILFTGITTQLKF